MSTHNPASTPASSKGSEVPAAQPPHELPKGNSSRNRSLFLVGILAVLLLALWYDYKVARPNVESAYESVGKMNSDYNSLPGKKYVTEKEVQLTLNRKPASVIQEGPYHVEVYSWRAGLPIRSHNYYAVYSAGTPLIFLKHYKFELPLDELQAIRIGAIGDEEVAPEFDKEMKESLEFGQKERERRGSEEGSEESSAGPSALKTDAAPATEPEKESAPTEAAKDATPTETAKDAPATEQPKTTEATSPAPATKSESGDK